MAFLKLSVNRLQRDWRELCLLSWQERWLLFQAIAFLPMMAAGLHLMNFQRLRSMLERFSPVPPDVCGDAALKQASGTARLIHAAAFRMPFNITCLVRSVTLWWFLRRQGIPSEIRIGVNQQNGEFQAHAWVEINGMVLNDRHDIHDQYSPFDQITLQNGVRKV